MGFALLAQASLPFSFWWEAFHTTVYLINILPTHTLSNSSPFSLLFHHLPDYKFLKVFGCAFFFLFSSLITRQSFSLDHPSACFLATTHIKGTSAFILQVDYIFLILFTSIQLSFHMLPCSLPQVLVTLFLPLLALFPYFLSYLLQLI